MNGTNFQILKVQGIPIRINVSWFVVLLLFTWSLATGWFPVSDPGLTTATYWTMGLVASLGLFASILLHELGHAFTALRMGLHIRGITLFLFGGVAEMEDEPPDPRSELLIAVAGPVVSVLIALFCWMVAVALGAILPITVLAILRYLTTINLVVVAFNLLPAFPLDGGRVFRSILWKSKGSLRQATKVAAGFGQFFGALLIAVGVLNFIGGSVVGGMWLALIGLFLRGAAQSSYRQVLLRRMFEGEPVMRFAKTEVLTVPPHITLRTLVEEHVYRHHHKMFPVLAGDRLLGCVTTQAIKKIPSEEWSTVSVESVLDPVSDENSIDPGADAITALTQMTRGRRSRLLVVTPDGRLAGILTLKDLLEFFQLKMELEDTG
jgi:Zn-dependent protease/CBS domain-containing protein